MDGATIQQRAASIIASVVLAAVAIWLILLAWSAFQEDGSVGMRPRLDLQWAILKWWIGDSSTVAKLFAGMLLILSAGAQFLAKFHTKLWSLLAICFMCLIAIAAAVLFLVYGNDPSLDIFRQFRSVVGGAPQTVSGAVTNVIGSTIGWLVSFMALQLGISIKNSEGAIKSLIS
jgi:hypothetical protein